MKGMALHDRLKEKDSYDIYFCIRYFPGGIDALAELFKPHLSHKLVKEGLLKIQKKFKSPEHLGPNHVADFNEVRDPEERERLKRDVFERVNALMEKLGIVKP
jgi:hypothetical protein